MRSCFTAKANASTITLRRSAVRTRFFGLSDFVTKNVEEMSRSR